MIHVLFPSLIATLGAVTTCSESSADLDSQNCGASWLQERYQLHSGNETLAGARHVDWEPHVSGSELAILAVLVFLVFILMHECWVGRGKDPILATEPIRVISACSVYLFVVELSLLIVVPLSMDYALAMGELVAASGAVLGVTLPAQYVGYRIGVWMDEKSDWFRIKCVVCHVVALLCYLGLTLLLLSAARSGHALRQTFWIAICVQVAATTFRNIPSSTWKFIHDIPSEDADYKWSKFGGSLCGPTLFAFMVYQMHSLSPVGMMACTFGVVLVGQAILTALTALTFKPYSMIDSMMTEESRNEASEEKLPKSDEATKRETLVWNLIIYWYEHNISFFASEYGMITILEITYGWSVGACALAMSAKQVARFLIIRMLGKIHETTSFTERQLFLASDCVAMCFSLLLFQWHWTGSSGAISLLVADSMIYSFTCATCTPARTWCVHSYTGRPDLQWLQTEHRWQAGHVDAVCSLLVSILIRFLVDKGGRNYFAIFQLVVRFLAFCTACKAVSLKQEVDKDRLVTRASAVAAGEAATYAISEAGELVCFGKTEDALPPHLGPVVAVAAGMHHTCAVKANGKLVCFGDNGFGQRDVPPHLGPVVAVAAGMHHTCAVKANGKLVCFGGNDCGQRDVPSDLGPVVVVAAGMHHTCAVKANGKLVCFGGNDCGQRDVPSDLGPVVAVAAGMHHTCAVKANGKLVCFGGNDRGQRVVPSDLGPVVAVAAGMRHTCAVKANGKLVCFGDNGFGQCDVPSDLDPVVAVAAGMHHTCAVQASGKLVCFGGNDCGQNKVPPGLKVRLAPRDPTQEVLEPVHHSEPPADISEEESAVPPGLKVQLDPTQEVLEPVHHSEPPADMSEEESAAIVAEPAG